MALFPSILKKFRSLFTKEKPPLKELEKLFYEADLGSSLTQDLLKKVEKSGEDPLTTVRNTLLSLFPNKEQPPLAHPHIILIVGANGTGKTTSIGKLSAYFQAQGKSVLIAASDTFRAASVEQLEVWAQKTKAHLIKSQKGSDPASVAFDAISSALAKNTDLVLIDTAGRLQNKKDLMQELEKIQRIIQKKIPSAPHETLLVLDATTGQNALDQAKTFHAFVPLSGIILTKCDGSAKGGMAAALQKELSIPIQWIGAGETLETLAPFDASKYVEEILSL